MGTHRLDLLIPEPREMGSLDIEFPLYCYILNFFSMKCFQLNAVAPNSPAYAWSSLELCVMISSG